MNVEDIAETFGLSIEEVEQTLKTLEHKALVVRGLRTHPAADAWPMMDRERYAELRADIATNGQREPITLFDDMILDGRNRYQACIELGIEPITREYSGDPWAFAWSLNGTRRDLEATVRALIYRRCQEGSEKWRKRLAKIAEDGNRKKSEAAAAGKVGRAAAKSKSSDASHDDVRLKKSGKNVALPARAADAKVSPATMARADQIAKRPDLEEKVVAGKMKPAEALREIRNTERERIKREAVEHLSEREAESFGIQHCSLTEWNAPACQLVFTDPPYHDKHVERFRELGRFAMEHLDAGRFLCTYTGKLRLADCISAVMQAGLEWVWIFSVYHPFSKEKHLGGVYNIAENWRPVLVFRKPGPVWSPRFQQDVVRGERSKSHHDWSQDEQTPEQLIQAYSHAGETVLDPFCGGGTTPLVAKRVGRKCFACDVDIAAVAMATDRIRGNQGR
jgi:hypothetical protein